jgi:hypothetical protein
MRNLARILKRHFGPAAPHVAVRAEVPWYWRFFWVVLLIVAGFSVGYWRFAGGNTGVLRDEIARLEQENKALHTQAIHVERQQQVTTVAQGDLAKDLAALQEENVRLKEDVTFYKSILEESTGVAVVKLHSFKVTHGEQPGEYKFRLVLIQSGKHDKNVQGSLQLTMLGTQDGKSVTQIVMSGKNPQQGDRINFKYYQPIEGSFKVPGQMSAHSLQVKFFQTGSTEPKLTQEVSLTS